MNHKGQIVGKIEDKEIPFLVNTGATVSLLNFKAKVQLSTDTVDRVGDRDIVDRVQGVTGKKEQLLSQPLLLWRGGQGVWGRFVITEDSLMCLLG